MSEAPKPPEKPSIPPPREPGVSPTPKPQTQGFSSLDPALRELATSVQKDIRDSASRKFNELVDEVKEFKPPGLRPIFEHALKGYGGVGDLVDPSTPQQGHAQPIPTVKPVPRELPSQPIAPHIPAGTMVGVVEKTRGDDEVIKKVQRLLGIPATGVWDEACVQELDQALASQVQERRNRWLGQVSSMLAEAGTEFNGVTAEVIERILSQLDQALKRSQS